MKAEEFIKLLNEIHGIKPWPKSLTTDPETYANCCQYVFDQAKILVMAKGFDYVEIAIGHSKGLIFKGMELTIKSTS